MLMAKHEALPPMTLDHLTGREGEPLTPEEIAMNKVLVDLGLDPMRNRERPACPWPHPHGTVKCWYPLLSEPQQEVRTSVVLKSYRVPHYLPLVPHVTTRGVRRTKVISYRPMLRGYLLVSDDGLEPLASLRRPLPIHGFLRFGDQLAVVSDAEIAKLRNIEEELAKPKPVQSIWDVGEVVRIGDGPFTGLNATITDLANGKRITVEVAFMKRAVPMSMDADQLEKL